MRLLLSSLPVLMLSVACTVGPDAPAADRESTDAVDGYLLYTHCGILELEHDGKWYRRIGGILDDNHRNPPDGWDNPTQTGTLTIRGETAVFTDRHGHRERFRLQENQEEGSQTCM